MEIYSGKLAGKKVEQPNAAKITFTALLGSKSMLGTSFCELLSPGYEYKASSNFAAKQEICSPDKNNV